MREMGYKQGFAYDWALRGNLWEFVCFGCFLFPCGSVTLSLPAPPNVALVEGAGFGHESPAA